MSRSVSVKVSAKTVASFDRDLGNGRRPVHVVTVEVISAGLPVVQSCRISEVSVMLYHVKQVIWFLPTGLTLIAAMDSTR